MARVGLEGGHSGQAQVNLLKCWKEGLVNEIQEKRVVMSLFALLLVHTGGHCCLENCSNQPVEKRGLGETIAGNHL